MKTISIYTPTWDVCDSYGIKAVALARGIELAGYRVNRMGLDEQPIQPTPGGFLLGYPTLYGEWGPLANMGRRVAVTAWESTEIPPAWLVGLEKVDYVSVGSSFTRDVLIDCGVTTPVFVVPLGVSETYRYVERPVDREPFTFLAFGDRGARKGWDIAIHAFVKAFGDDPRYKLIIKCREGGLENLRLGHDNIEIRRADLDERGMLALFAEADVMVFPTLGEGFGMPPREFAATGGMVLATGFSGVADEANVWGPAIEYQLVKAWPGHDSFEGLGQWAQPDTEHLAVLMRWAANPVTRQWWSMQSKRISMYFKHKYSWLWFAQKHIEIWKGVHGGNGQPARATQG
jgi:glycosyltransferase involved in cell wall biosynthesis